MSLHPYFRWRRDKVSAVRRFSRTFKVNGKGCYMMIMSPENIHDIEEVALRSAFGKVILIDN